MAWLCSGAMATVSVSSTFAASPADAEARWCDTGSWPRWVDGLEQVLEVGAAWPNQGATVVWVSGPAGRGRVVERVTGHEPGASHTVDVEDDSITGRQTVSFIRAPSTTATAVLVELTLAYTLKRRSLLSPVVDALFIRRAFAASLNRTLERFGVIVASAAAPVSRT